MRIGVPKEIKNHENRVALTPAGAAQLTEAGHQVLIQKGAGEGSGFSDDEYRKAGATVADSAEEVWGEAGMIMKVKEPLPEEYRHFRDDLILFAYLHLAAEPRLTEALLASGTAAVAYETVQPADGSLPLLTPMSEVAGRMSVQIGARLLEKSNGGSGVLLGGVPGVPPAEVVILGGGVVGTNAAKIAVGMGAATTVIDNRAQRLRELDDLFGGRVHTLMSNPGHIEEAVQRADLVIGAVLIPGARAPKLVRESMVRKMKPGSVIVDVAVDQGGSIETVDRVTSHSDPTYVKHGVVHYAVPNIPGAVPRTSTLALTNVTLPYALKLAGGDLRALAADPRSADLMRGVNVYRGHIVHEGLAKSIGQPYRELRELLP